MFEWEYAAGNICAGSLFRVWYQTFISKVDNAFGPVCCSKGCTKIFSSQVKERLQKFFPHKIRALEQLLTLHWKRKRRYYRSFQELIFDGFYIRNSRLALGVIYIKLECRELD